MVPLRNADVIHAPSPAPAVQSCLLMLNEPPGGVPVRAQSVCCDGKQWEDEIRVGFNAMYQTCLELSLQLQVGMYYSFSLINLLIFMSFVTMKRHMAALWTAVLYLQTDYRAQNNDKCFSAATSFQHTPSLNWRQYRSGGRAD